IMDTSELDEITGEDIVVPSDSEKADLKVAINKIKLGIKKYEKAAMEFQIKAKKAVVSGNMKLAKNYLLRKKRAMKNLEQFEGFIIKLERQSDAIDSAETIKTMGKTMQSTTSALRKAVDELNPEEIMEMNEESEEAIAYLEESAEIMSESLDSTDDIELDDELEALKAEVLLEGEGGLTATPERMDFTLDDDELIDEEEPTKSEKLKKELEKLQKELEG
ncbi:MAG: Snf7 family protein, partial [Candidatus Hodarchaeota archaeon]